MLGLAEKILKFSFLPSFYVSIGDFTLYNMYSLLTLYYAFRYTPWLDEAMYLEKYKNYSMYLVE